MFVDNYADFVASHVENLLTEATQVLEGALHVDLDRGKHLRLARLIKLLKGFIDAGHDAFTATLKLGSLLTALSQQTCARLVESNLVADHEAAVPIQRAIKVLLAILQQRQQKVESHLSRQQVDVLLFGVKEVLETVNCE